MGKMTDAQIRAMKGSEKWREVFVDDNLYLKVTLRKNGITKKKWRLRFTDQAGGRQNLTFGEYPEIGLAQAREMAADLLKRARRGGTLPIPGKRAAATFGELSEEWFGRQSKSWVAGHALRQRERLDSVNRAMGGKDFNLVTMEDIAASVSRKVDAGTLEIARRTLSMIRKILEYADTLGRLEDNRILIGIDSYRKSLPPRAGTGGISTGR